MVVKIIELKDVSFGYSKKQIFEKFNLAIEKGEFVTLAGSNGSGKSTLLKLIAGFYEFKGTICVDKIPLTVESKADIRKKLGMIFDHPDLNFVTETVEDEIVFPMENLQYSKEKMEERLNEVLSIFELEEVKECSVHQLSGGQKQLVAFASAYAYEPSVLLLDEAFSMVDLITKQKLFRILKKLKRRGTTILQVTNDLEESLFSDRIILFRNGCIMKDGTKLEVLSDERTLAKVGLEAPFSASLSTKLIYYNLLEEPVLELDRMVEQLWK